MATVEGMRDAYIVTRRFTLYGKHREPGDIVYPDEMPYGLSDKLIAQRRLQRTAVPAESEPDAGETVPGVPDFDAMNVDKLRTFAKEHDINLEGATRRDDILEHLNAWVDETYNPDGTLVEPEATSGDPVPVSNVEGNVVATENVDAGDPARPVQSTGEGEEQSGTDSDDGDEDDGDEEDDE